MKKTKKKKSKLSNEEIKKRLDRIFKMKMDLKKLKLENKQILEQLETSL